MTNPLVEILGTFDALHHRLDAATSRFVNFIIKRITVHILEMEDVLYHLDSAVMMPEKPVGKSSTQGVGDNPDDAKMAKEENQVSGLRALALGLLQFEFDPRLRLLIAGHTDTSGPADMNFTLSDLRAKGVLYLLVGNREEWARVSTERHKIEDYQQIMEYVASNRPWNCHPGKLDNTWGDKTSGATKKFIENYNAWVVSGQAPEESDQITPGVYDQIEKKPDHKWPIEMWRAVYDIYIDDMAAAMTIERNQMGKYRSQIQFANKDKKYIACGKSFPIDSVEKDHYRSQLNRRVELLFFDQGEIPKIECPPRIATVHTEEECPIWHKLQLSRVYIDPADLTVVTYHLKFVYYDRVHKKMRDVPEGLKIKAFENDSKEIKHVRIEYSGGVYTLKVPDKPSPERTDIHFTFEMEDAWIYSAGGKTDPVIETREVSEAREGGKTLRLTKKDGKEEWDKLMPLDKRIHYYDLPEVWSSQNYWTRYDGDMNKGERFLKVLNDKQFKPYGGNVTSAAQPLTFCLDDIVLLDTITGTQDIRDANHSNENHDLSTVATRLSNNKAGNRVSRVKILLVDEETGHLKLYYREYKDEDGEKKPVQNSARIPFPENLIVEKHEDVETAKIVFFRDGFYTIGDKRTRVLSNWETNGFVVGARAAVRDDTDFHMKFPMPTDSEFRFTGDYDWHFVHHLCLEGNHPVSYFIYHLSISFIRDVRNPANGNPIPAAADVLNFVDSGVYNAMDRWNIKKRYFDEETTSDNSELIRPFYFFDERETFVIPDADHPVETVSVSYDDTTHPAVALPALQALFNSPAFTNARQNALGGKSKFVALITRNENGKLYGPAYAWPVRLDGLMYSIFKLNRSAWEDVEVNHPGAGEIFTDEDDTGFFEFGETFGIFTAAHEFGHACGLPDEYILRSLRYAATVFHAFPGYDLHFEPYSPSYNVSSMMYHNRAPRLHHLWYGLHFINSQIADGSLTFFADNKRFVARFVHEDADLTYHRGKLTREATGVRHLDAGSIRLPLDFKEPLRTTEHFAIPGTTDKQLRLSLFDLGQDESSHDNLYPNQNYYDYQGILCVRILLQVNFVGAWTQDQMSLKLTLFEGAYLRRNAKYRLVGGTKGIQKIYLYFYPGFRTDADPQTNYIVDFLPEPPPPSPPPSGDKIGQVSGRLQVRSDASAEDLVAYILHTASAPNELTGLGFLRSWVNTQLKDPPRDPLPDTFTLEEIT